MDTSGSAAATAPTAPTAAYARRQLSQAGSAGSDLAARGRWFRTYLLAFGVESLVLVVLLGLGGRGVMVAAMVGWGVLVAVMAGWASRQRVQLTGAGRRLTVAFAAWGVLYGLALVIGLSSAPGAPAFWVPAAVVVAAPLLVAAMVPLPVRGVR